MYGMLGGRQRSFFLGSLQVEVCQVAPPGHPPEVREVAGPGGVDETSGVLVPINKRTIASCLT